MTNVFTKITAFILLICSIPLMLFVATLILVFERDKIFFLQSRVGLNHKLFTIIKLRTMQHQKTTFLGRIIRKTGIDEIPQLINIIKGDIHFIGPRPLTQFDIDRLEWNTKFHKKRWSIKPGLTGLGQLSPICHKKMTLFWDNYYVNHHSFGLNFKIITLTFLTLFLGKNRVKKIIQNKLKK